MRQVGSPTPAIGRRINPYEYRCENTSSTDCSSCQALFEERIQLRLSGVFRDRLLHLQGGLPAAELEGGEVVIEPRLFVHQAPAQWRFFDAGEASERFSDELAEPRPARAKADPLREAERVPERRAGRLVEGTLGAIPDRDLGQVAVVHIAGEDHYRGWRFSLRAFAECYGP